VARRPPDPWIVHPLPAAPRFVGRAAELEALRTCHRDEFRGVLALVGLGGAGKTAVAARFLDELLAADPTPNGLFVWSFYQQPDAGLFLREANRYFAHGAAAASGARGSGLLHLLHDSLAAAGRCWLVLDGLERVQQQESTGAYGRLEDPLLKGLLLRLAEGVGRAAVLVTSRFPLTDLAALEGHGYRPVEVGGIDADSARNLLRSRGVQGDDAALGKLVDAYGAHALTLDHLGGVIGQFNGGDPARAPEAPGLAAPGGDRQALRLARLLRAYEEHLPPTELALLCRLCLLRRSATQEQIAQLFLCAPAVRAHTIRTLREQIAHLPFPGREPRPDLTDYAAAIGSCLEEILCAAPLAGPEDAFRHEVLTAATRALELPQEDNDAHFAELAGLYGTADLDTTSDRRPLSARDRMLLRELSGRYLELRRHPLMPIKHALKPALAEAFEKLSRHQPRRRWAADLRPDDLLYAYQRVGRQLWYLGCKHTALRCVRELAASYQRKWSLAGPLAPLDAGELRRVLDALVGRHLAVQEADGSFSIHPAVRDYFHRLAVADGQSGWHDLLRAQLISLIRQPGQRLPEDPATLDLVEEAVYHALQAGRADEARWLYQEVLGGMRHLAWKLGETARGLRVLRTFPVCPDRDALAWFLRALGEFEAAHAQHPMCDFRADVRLLQGRLPEVAAEDDQARTGAAAFLMGRSRELPPDLLGCTVPRAQLLLYLGRLDAARHAAAMETVFADVGWEGQRARYRLLQADAARRRGDADGGGQYLDAATGWILHSGSVEHLGLLHLVQARAARSVQDAAAARAAVEAGLHLTRRCGLGLLYIELLCEQAEQRLAAGDAAGAEASAHDALGRAVAADCQFLWGAAEAGHLLGQALAAQGDERAAAAVLREALERRRRLCDPRTAQTERLLVRLGF
jgi:hypothetical protein